MASYRSCSKMVSYLSSTASAFVVTNGKLADIAQAYNNETTIIIDLSRTQTDKIDHIYSLMESFKNGRILLRLCKLLKFVKKVPYQRGHGLNITRSLRRERETFLDSITQPNEHTFAKHRL